MQRYNVFLKLPNAFSFIGSNKETGSVSVKIHGPINKVETVAFSSIGSNTANSIGYGSTNVLIKGGIQTISGNDAFYKIGMYRNGDINVIIEGRINNIIGSKKTINAAYPPLLPNFLEILTL